MFTHNSTCPQPKASTQANAITYYYIQTRLTYFCFRGIFFKLTEPVFVKTAAILVNYKSHTPMIVSVCMNANSLRHTDVFVRIFLRFSFICSIEVVIRLSTYIRRLIELFRYVMMEKLVVLLHPHIVQLI